MKKVKKRRWAKTILGFIVATLSLVLVSLWMSYDTAQVQYENTYKIEGIIENVQYRTPPQRASQINFSVNGHNLVLTWRGSKKEGYEAVNRLTKQTEPVYVTVFPSRKLLWGREQAISIHTQDEVYGSISAFNQYQKANRVFGLIGLSVFWIVYFLFLAFYIIFMFQNGYIKKHRKRRKS